jgi:hypothetical protein
MSKQKLNVPKMLDDAPPADDPAPATIRVELPVAPLPAHGFRSQRLDLSLTRRQAEALHCVLHGLHVQHAQLREGRHVENIQHALRWILEQIADEIDASGPSPINPN